MSVMTGVVSTMVCWCVMHCMTSMVVSRCVVNGMASVVVVNWCRMVVACMAVVVMVGANQNWF